jgi:hypothetical protein
MVRGEEVVNEFEYCREWRWGYTHEVVVEIVYFVHQRWRVPIGRIIGGSGASRWNILLVCLVSKLLKGSLPCGSSSFGCGDGNGFHFDVFRGRGSGGDWVSISSDHPIGRFDF